MTRPNHVRVPLIGRFAPPFGSDYVAVEVSGAFVLLLAALAALAWSNSPLGRTYDALWAHQVHLGIGPHTLAQWVNEGLMAVFFFVIGLEIKRELVLGELHSLRAAMLPVVAAVG